MHDVTCKLVQYVFVTDDIGNETAQKNIVEIPLIAIEDIYSTEFYEASQQGFKPSLRLRISSINYNDESELEYMNQRYTVIRVQNEGDETILICERMIVNGN